MPKLPPGKKPRDMDKFLEELKRSLPSPSSCAARPSFCPVLMPFIS